MRTTARWAASNERWLSVIAATASALLFSIYTGIATTSPPASGSGFAAFVDRLSDLGSVNFLALGGLLALVAQAVLAEAGTQSRRIRQQAEGEQLTEVLLEGVNGLLRAQNPGPVYRSLVAIADRKRGGPYLGSWGQHPY